MRHTFLRCYLLLPLAFAIAGCGGPVDLGNRYAFPTVGPVTRQGGRTNILAYSFTASTNCASIGETVTFIATLKNISTVPITITTTPTVDFVVRPVHWSVTQTQPEPVRRWSETPMYPSSVDFVLTPGVEYTYRWDWIAEDVYDGSGVKGAIIQFFLGEMQSPIFLREPGGPDLFVDVGRVTGGDSGYGLSCAEMRAQQN